jgi:hypothetical protein
VNFFVIGSLEAELKRRGVQLLDSVCVEPWPLAGIPDELDETPKGASLADNMSQTLGFLSKDVDQMSETHQEVGSPASPPSSGRSNARTDIRGTSPTKMLFSIAQR